MSKTTQNKMLDSIQDSYAKNIFPSLSGQYASNTISHYSTVL